MRPIGYFLLLFFSISTNMIHTMHLSEREEQALRHFYQHYAQDQAQYYASQHYAQAQAQYYAPLQFTNTPSHYFQHLPSAPTNFSVPTNLSNPNRPYDPQLILDQEAQNNAFQLCHQAWLNSLLRAKLQKINTHSDSFRTTPPDQATQPEKTLNQKYQEAE